MSINLYRRHTTLPLLYRYFLYIFFLFMAQPKQVWYGVSVSLIVRKFSHTYTRWASNDSS